MSEVDVTQNQHLREAFTRIVGAVRWFTSEDSTYINPDTGRVTQKVGREHHIIMAARKAVALAMFEVAFSVDTRLRRQATSDAIKAIDKVAKEAMEDATEAMGSDHHRLFWVHYCVDMAYSTAFVAAMNVMYYTGVDPGYLESLDTVDQRLRALSAPRLRDITSEGPFLPNS